MTPFTELRAPRLTLRPLSAADAAAICGYRSDPAVARYQSWESFGPADAAALVDRQAGIQPGTPGTWFQLALVLSATGAVVGDCGLHCRREDPRQMEVGITVAAAHQGRGYATEAVAAVLDFIFDDPRTHRVSAVTDAENAPAAALFRRLGFRQEAHFIDHLWFKGRWGSEFVFALLRREWERRRTAARETTAGRPPFRGAGTP